MGKFEGEVIDGPKEQTFADWSSFDFLKPKIELVGLKIPSTDLLGRP
jgi:hypothetical protein